MSSDKYIHSDVENKIYSYWEKHGLFKPQENSKKFSFVIPPLPFLELKLISHSIHWVNCTHFYITLFSSSERRSSAPKVFISSF